MQRHAFAVAAIVVALVACERRASGDVTLDRGGHAGGRPGHTLSGEAVAGADETTYTVRDGDTLTAIAQAHGLPVEHLIRRNRLASHELQPGRRLVVPAVPRTP